MRILFVNQHYPPDSGATGKLLAQLSEELVERGHEVTVLTGRPTYEEALSAAAPARETRRGVTVLRLPLLRRRHGPIGRALHYASFALALLGRGIRVPRPDVVLAFSSTPMFGGVASLALARLHRAPFVYVVQDLYPEIAVALDVLPEGWLQRIARRLETVAWRGASRVVLIGKDLAAAAQLRGVDGSRLRVVPNWADPDQIRPQEGTIFRESQGLARDDFVVQYAGNFGRSQDLENVLEAARIVEREGARSVRFLLVGAGSLSKDVDRAAREVPGVSVVPFQPEERLGEVLAAADLSLVPLRKGLSRYCVPSKVYSILASGRPVGASVDAGSDVARLVEEANCGFTVDPDDPESLAREILRLAGDPELARRQGENGRRYGEEAGSLRRAADQYEAALCEAIGGSRNPAPLPTSGGTAPTRRDLRP